MHKRRFLPFLFPRQMWKLLGNASYNDYGEYFVDGSEYFLFKNNKKENEFEDKAIYFPLSFHNLIQTRNVCVYELQNEGNYYRN